MNDVTAVATSSVRIPQRAAAEGMDVYLAEPRADARGALLTRAAA
jgi:hypothetical protein